MRSFSFPLVAVVALLSASSLLAAEPTPTAQQTPIPSITAAVSPAELRATIEKLVSFGTRHTMSETKSNRRGIGAARRWTEARFGEIGKACGGCLTIAVPSEVVTGPRVPTPTEVVDVLAIQRGTSDPNRVIIISGHIDSRVTDVMDAKSDAPGANDDASGVAAVIETTRVLSKHKFPATLVYAVLSGEEQGLYGGKILADYAKAQGWTVEAVLNNDIVGNSEGSSGERDNTHVRVFSEGTKAVETPEQANRRRYNGGEVDSPSRNLARFIDRVADEYLTNMDVEMVYRTDRYGRGGDQVRMLEAGFPSVRVTEAAENYDRQHQDLRTDKGRRYGDTIDGVDFPYLAQVTRLNVAVMAALAMAPMPPAEVKIEGAVKPDTSVSWTPVPGAAGYRVWWRSTTAPQWQHSRRAGADATSLTLPGIVIDDWFFGVSAVSAEGYDSPIEFPGPAGSFVSKPEAPAAK